MLKQLLSFILLTGALAFGQAPVLTFQKLRNVDPPTIRLLWNAVSTPTPDYDVYQAPAVAEKCPALTATSWTKIADNLAMTQLDVVLPFIVNGHRTALINCWYVQGYVNGVVTAPSNVFEGWAAAFAYVYPDYVAADPVTNGCSTSTNEPNLPVYPYTSGGSLTITRTLNGVKSAESFVVGPLFIKNTAGQTVNAQYEVRVNVLDGASYLGTLTYPDGDAYSFPMFTNWADVEPSADFYDIWLLGKLVGSKTICRRQLYQLDEPAN